MSNQPIPPEWHSIPKLSKLAQLPKGPVTLTVGENAEKVTITNYFDLARTLKQEIERLETEFRQISKVIGVKLMVVEQKTVTDDEEWTYTMKDGYPRRTLDTEWAKTKLVEKGVKMAEIEKHTKVTEVQPTTVISKPKGK